MASQVMNFINMPFSYCAQWFSSIMQSSKVLGIYFAVFFVYFAVKFIIRPVFGRGSDKARRSNDRGTDNE